MKSVRSNRRAIRIVSQCATAEEFVAAFHPYLERDSLFIATGSPEEPGQAIRFVMTLAGGETMLRGAGRVLECHRDRGNFYGLRGMKLQFDELDDGSRRALAALESRAGGRPPRGAAAGQHPGEVLECLIYDEPGTESADPSAASSRARASRAMAERGLPAVPTADDDDVTAVAAAPARPPVPGQVAGRGTGPIARQTRPPQRTASPATFPVPMHQSPQVAAPHGQGHDNNHGSGFSVPRPRSEPGGPPSETPLPGHAPHGVREMPGRVPSGRMSALHGAASGRPGPDIADLPTDMLPAARVRAAAAPAKALASAAQPAPQGAGSGPLVEFDPSESSRPRLAGGVAREDIGLGTGPPHMPPPELAGFPQGDFGMPPTRAVGRRGVPRPPMPAERTELVRIVRPSHVRTAALSATLGAVLGLSVGYLLWGMDQSALAGGHDQPAAAKPAPPEPPPAPREPPAAVPGADAGADGRNLNHVSTESAKAEK
ncbi:MAG TPA: hypothetical protein VKB80_22685 [Kofleriaceae bacterium]|nr:hypothetical protein [Kofleriaceae bacterium]